ncbi:hypothetical protein LTS08_001369 [Lithohypha guttulata]|nr:hypothetical protein LTS08_001369 [Lithohypha guttulata]
MAQSTQNDVSSLLQDNIRSTVQPDTATSPTSRTPYRRQPSWQSSGKRYQHVSVEDHGIAEEVAEEEEDNTEARGLGLTNLPKSTTSSVVRRVPVGGRSTPEPSGLLGSARSDPLSQASTARNTDEIDTSYHNKWHTPSHQSSAQSLRDEPYKHVPSEDNLLSHNHDHAHDHIGCSTQQGPLKERWSWLTWIVIFLAIYTTLLSAAFLVIAIARPRWGHRIGTRGRMTYNSATFLSAFISKTIELSFATTFVATLGQILSRRAFARENQAGGISIAEMNMRLWIMQPGTLVTHFVGVKYVARTLLGVTALLAAFAATFYTTASEALVAPKLKYGRNETVILFGQVRAGYANSVYLREHCETPITERMDADAVARGNTCLQFDYAGNGFRNLGSWRNKWAERQASSTNTDGNSPRPLPISILFENTTVTGQWINDLYGDIERQSKQYGRLVQNVTMAMPHANVYHAARDQMNRILQPDDLSGSGEYFLQAAVPAPALNVLCVGADDWEVNLLVGNASHHPENWPVETPFDEFFNWKQEDPAKVGGQWAPWFGKLPIVYNTVVNHTVNWGSEWIYLLGKPDQATIGPTNNYTICGIRSYQHLDCSTSLWETKSGGQLSVHCGNNNTRVWKKYSETKNASEPQAQPPSTVDSRNWKDVGMEWINSLSLGQGISDGNASIARFLTQSISKYTNDTGTKLSPVFPSIAEGICLLGGYTLLMSSDVAPFVHYWTGASDLAPIFDPSQAGAFEALLSYKDYSSGYDANWKGVFYIILISVLVLNVFCTATLLWYFIHYGEVTDYTEPQNLFALAINSPKSSMLAGACGGGPSGEVLGKKWCVEMSRAADHNPNLYGNLSSPHSPYRRNSMPDPSHPHFYVRYPEEEPLMDVDTVTASNTTANTPNPQAREGFLSKVASPMKRSSKIWSSPRLEKRRSRLSMVLSPGPEALEETELQDNPVAQYMKLTGGRT